MYSKKPVILVSILIGLTIASWIGTYWVNLRISQPGLSGKGFLNTWMAARYWLIEGVSPYDEKVNLAIQIASYGHPADLSQGETKLNFRDPLPLLFFIAPFGLIQFPNAVAGWMSLIEVCLIALVIVGIKLADWDKLQWEYLLAFCLFGVLSFPAMANILESQPGILSVVLIFLTILLIHQKGDILAGISLALSLVKPALAILFVVYTIIWAASSHRKDIIWGFIGGGTIILGISLLFLNDWLIQLFRQVITNPQPYTSLINLISSATPGIKRQLNFILYLGSAGILIFEWVRSLKPNDRNYLWTAYFTITLSFFLMPIAQISNTILLIPILIIIFKVLAERWRMVGQGLIWLILGILGIGIWLIVLYHPGAFDQVNLIFPIFVLLGLWWTRWWVLNPPRLLLDEIGNKLS